MEIQQMPVADIPESETLQRLEEFEMDRIAFELWQRGSLPEVPETTQAEIEEVAAHASCL